MFGPSGVADLCRDCECVALKMLDTCCEFTYSLSNECMVEKPCVVPFHPTKFTSWYCFSTPVNLTNNIVWMNYVKRNDVLHSVHATVNRGVQFRWVDYWRINCACALHSVSKMNQIYVGECKFPPMNASHFPFSPFGHYKNSLDSSIMHIAKFYLLISCNNFRK